MKTIRAFSSLVTMMFIMGVLANPLALANDVTHNELTAQGPLTETRKYVVPSWQWNDSVIVPSTGDGGTGTGSGGNIGGKRVIEIQIWEQNSEWQSPRFGYKGDPDPVQTTGTGSGGTGTGSGGGKGGGKKLMSPWVFNSPIQTWNTPNYHFNSPQRFDGQFESSF
jgi:hypothetical protein